MGIEFSTVPSKRLGRERRLLCKELPARIFFLGGQSAFAKCWPSWKHNTFADVALNCWSQHVMSAKPRRTIRGLPKSHYPLRSFLFDVFLLYKLRHCFRVCHHQNNPRRAAELKKCWDGRGEGLPVVSGTRYLVPDTTGSPSPRPSQHFFNSAALRGLFWWWHTLKQCRSLYNRNTSKRKERKG